MNEIIKSYIKDIDRRFEERQQAKWEEEHPYTPQEVPYMHQYEREKHRLRALNGMMHIWIGKYAGDEDIVMQIANETRIPYRVLLEFVADRLDLGSRAADALYTYLRDHDDTYTVTFNGYDYEALCRKDDAPEEVDGKLLWGRFIPRYIKYGGYYFYQKTNIRSTILDLYAKGLLPDLGVKAKERLSKLLDEMEAKKL